MNRFFNYLGAHKNLSVAVLAVGFVAASVSLYMAVVTYLFIQYASLQAAACLLLALIFDVGIAVLLCQNTRRSFRPTIAFTSAAIAVGAIVVSIGVLRGHWAVTVRQLVKELTSN